MKSTALWAGLILFGCNSGLLLTGCTSLGQESRSTPKISQAIEPVNEFGFDSDDNELSVGIEKLLTSRGFKMRILRNGVQTRYVLRVRSTDLDTCLPEGSRQMHFNVSAIDSDTGKRVLLIAGEYGCKDTIIKRVDEWLPTLSPDSPPAAREIAPGVATSPAIPKTLHSSVDKPRYTTKENPNNYAVVVGAEKYASLPTAEFSERDAEAVRAHLTAMGYPMRNIYFLNAQQATRAKIAQSVNTWLPNRVGEDSTVFFYYSGHGAPDPKTNQAFLVPVDGDAEDLDSTAYPVKELYAKLGNLKARQVIVALDSCFSGTGGRSVLAKGTRPLVGKIEMGGLPENVIALTASDTSQISGTIEDQGHGAFTYYLLTGLAGEARNDSGHVTVQSLFDYLTPKVQDAARLHNRDQTPQLFTAKREKASARLR